jgi:hypothetical protein
MRAVEFHSIVEDGHIAVPKTTHLADGLSVRVLILLVKRLRNKVSMQKAYGSEPRMHGRAAN